MIFTQPLGFQLAGLDLGIPVMGEMPKFRVIAVDWPWTYDNYGSKDHGAVKAHYPTMTIDEMVSLKVDLGWGPFGIWDYADPNGCALLSWGTSPKVEECAVVMRAHGFPIVTKAFCWVKTYADGSDYCGLGNYTRSSTEDCWMGRIGKVTVQDRSVRQLIWPDEEIIRSPRREHSRKPDEFYDRVEKLWGPARGQYLELFSRTNRPGWWAWGYDAGKFGVYRGSP